MAADISKNLQANIEQFSILTEKLRSGDPEMRRALLRQFRLLLAEVEQAIAKDDSYGQNAHANSTDH